MLDSLLAAGAADAWLSPIMMKRGQPAHTLSVLCSPDPTQRLRGVIFSATSTFGVREHPDDRTALRRCSRSVQGGNAQVRLKIALDDGDRVAHAMPEFEQASAAARASVYPVQRVLDEAAAAANRIGDVCPPTASAPGVR